MFHFSILATRLRILFAVKSRVQTWSGDEQKTIVWRTAQPIRDCTTDIDRQVLPFLVGINLHSRIYQNAGGRCCIRTDAPLIPREGYWGRTGRAKYIEANPGNQERFCISKNKRKINLSFSLP